MATIDKDGVEFLTICNERYTKDVYLFCIEVLKVIPSNQQEEFLRAVVDGKGRLAVKSGHGTGKTSMVSWVVLWFMCCFPNCEIKITANSAHQLYSTTMKEISMWYKSSILSELNLFEFTKDKIRINHDSYRATWFAQAVSVANEEGISGTHAENVLIVVDEACGVGRGIFERLQGALTTDNTKLILVGNPSFVNSYLFDVFHDERLKTIYDTFTFNSELSTNVTQRWIEDMRVVCGGTETAMYKVRVLGEFASLDEDTIISAGDVIEAVSREYVYPTEARHLCIGIDVSSGTGSDSSVICLRADNTELQRFKDKCELHELYERVCDIIEDNIPKYDKITVNIDTTGLGIQIGQDLLRKFRMYTNVQINAINFAMKATNSDTYGNIFTEMMFNLREKMKDINLLNIEDSTAVQELGGRRFVFDSSNRFIAERKKDFIARSGASPDEGDAIALAFYDFDGHNLNIGSLRR